MRLGMMLTAAFSLGMCAVFTHAAVVPVVSYTGADYVTTGQNLGGKGTGFDSNTAISPASGYSGQPFYGAVATSDATAAPLTTWAITNNLSLSVPGNSTYTADWIQLSNGSTSGAVAKSHYGLVLFKQADFENEGDGVAGGVTVTEDSTFQLRARRTGGSPSYLRFVMQTGGSTYHISESYTYGTDGALISAADPTALTWHAYSPASSISAIGATTSPDFTAVTGLGIWFQNDRAGNNNSGMNMNLTDIQFTAVVPEPASLGLLMAGALLAGRRRR